MPRTKRTAATAAAASIAATDLRDANDHSRPASPDDAAPSPPVKRTRRSTAAGSAAAGAKRATAAEKAAFARPDPIDDDVPVPRDELVGDQIQVLDLTASTYPDVSDHVYKDFALPEDNPASEELREALEGWEEYPERNATEMQRATAEPFTPGVHDRFRPGTKVPTLAQYSAAVQNGVIPANCLADVLLHEDVVFTPTYFPLPEAVSHWVDPADKRYKGFKRAAIAELATCHSQPTLTIVRPKIRTDPSDLRNYYEYPSNVDSATHRAPLMETVTYALDPTTDDISLANVKNNDFKHLEAIDTYNTKCKQITYAHSFERTARNTGYVVQYPVKSREVGVRTVWTIPQAARVPGGPTQFTIPSDQSTLFAGAIRPSMMPYIRIVLRPVRGCKYDQSAAVDAGGDADAKIKPRMYGYVWSLYLRTDKIMSAMQSASGTTGYLAKTAVRQLLAAVATVRGWIYSQNNDAAGSNSVTLSPPPEVLEPIPDVSPISLHSPQLSTLFMWMYTRERNAPTSNAFNLVLSDVHVRNPLIRIADQLYYAPLSGLFSTSPSSALILAEPVPPVPITCSDMLVKCADTHPAKYASVLALIKANPLMRPFPLPRSDLDLIPSRATLIVCSQVKVAHWAATAGRAFGADSVVVLDGKSELAKCTWEQVCSADVVIVSDKFMFCAYDQVLGEVAAASREGITAMSGLPASDRYAWADATARESCGGELLASNVKYHRQAAARQAEAAAANAGGDDVHLHAARAVPLLRHNPMEQLLLDLLRARDMDRARFGGRRRRGGFFDLYDDEDDYGDFGSGGYYSDEDDYGYGFGGGRRGHFDSDDEDDYYGRDPYDYDPEREYYEQQEEEEEAEREAAAAAAKAKADAAAAASNGTDAARAAPRYPRPKRTLPINTPRTVPTIEPVRPNRAPITDAPAYLALLETISTLSSRSDFRSTDIPVLLHAVHWHRLVFDGVTRSTTFAHVLNESRILHSNNKEFTPLRELHSSSSVTFVASSVADSEATELSSVDAFSTYQALGLRQGDEPPRNLPVRARHELIRRIGVHVPVIDPANEHPERRIPQVIVETITVYPSHYEHVRAVALSALVKDSLEASVRLVQDHHVWLNADARKMTSNEYNRDGRTIDALSMRVWKRGDSYAWMRFINMLVYAQNRGWVIEDILQDVLMPSRIEAREPNDVSMDPKWLADPKDWLAIAPESGNMWVSLHGDEHKDLYARIIKAVREELAVEPSGAAAKLLKALQSHVRDSRLVASQLEHDMRDRLKRGKTQRPGLDAGTYAVPLIQWLVSRGFTLGEIKTNLHFSVPATEAAHKLFGGKHDHEILTSFSSKQVSYPKSQTKEAMFHEAFDAALNLGLLWVKTAENIEVAEIASQVLGTMVEDVIKVRVPSRAHDEAVWTELKFGCSNCDRVFINSEIDEANWFPCGRRGCSSCRPEHTAKCKKCLERARLPPQRTFYGFHVAARYAVEAEWERVLHERNVFTTMSGKCLLAKNEGPSLKEAEEVVDNDLNQLYLGRDFRHEGASEFVRIFGSKIQAVVLYILKQLDANPDAKFVAFTEYDCQQSLLLMALHFVGIKSQLILDDSLRASVYPPVARFKSGHDVPVLIVPFSRCDPGMNLVEATHVLLLHPFAGKQESIVNLGEYGGGWRSLDLKSTGTLAVEVTATKERERKEADQRAQWKAGELECLRTVINAGNEHDTVQVARFVLSHTREQEFEAVKATEI